MVAILYALAFLVIPVQASLFFSDFAEPRAISYLRFCGAAILAWGLIVWFARNFEGRYAVRSVLIASVLGLAVNIVINVWATSGSVTRPVTRLGRQPLADDASAPLAISRPKNQERF